MAGRCTRRPVPSVLLSGLILLVATHLPGALHGPGFLGSHTSLTAVGAVQPVADVEAAVGPEHGHSHEAVASSSARSPDSPC
jgi:hypothetical protein